MQLQTEILVLVNSRLTDVNLDSIQPIHLTDAEWKLPGEQHNAN